MELRTGHVETYWSRSQRHLTNCLSASPFGFGVDKSLRSSSWKSVVSTFRAVGYSGIHLWKKHAVNALRSPYLESGEYRSGFAKEGGVV